MRPWLTLPSCHTHDAVYEACQLSHASAGWLSKVWPTSLADALHEGLSGGQHVDGGLHAHADQEGMDVGERLAVRLKGCRLHVGIRALGQLGQQL